MGLIAFAGVAQFLPSLLGGLYWHHASKSGAVAGLLAGVLVWAYTLLLPRFEGGTIPASLFREGPWGIAALRPPALFGADSADPPVPPPLRRLGPPLLHSPLVSPPPHRPPPHPPP